MRINPLASEFLPNIFHKSSPSCQTDVIAIQISGFLAPKENIFRA